MRIILMGATGFLGGEVLRQALADPEISHVTVIARRSVGHTHDKLSEVILSDFLDYSALDLSGADACIWCLGVSQTQVTQDEYIRITLDYAIAAARAMFSANSQSRFCFVSGRSADPDEKSSALFARVKGRTERNLLELNGSVFNFRPGYIRPTARSGPRKDLARFFAPVGMLISLFNEDFSVDCDQLACCLLDVAKNGSAQRLLVNRVIRSWRSPGRSVDPARRFEREDAAPHE
jgi:uncharacterized protein YbjT (DUF2867 family)